MAWLVLILALLPLSVAADELAAARNMPAGTVLGPGDVILAPSPRTGLTPDQAIGKALRTAAYQGRPIHAGQLTAPTLVSRNQVITLTYESAALRIETEGRALGAGAAGDVIRVMNIASRATMMARVNPDGTATVSQR